MTAIKFHLGSLSFITLIWSVAEYPFYFKEEGKGILTPTTTHFSTKYIIIYFYYTPAARRGGGYTVLSLSVCPSFRPSKIFFVAFFSATINGRNLIFGHKLHIGTPYRGKRFLTRQIPTSCCRRAGVSYVSISSQFILLKGSITHLWWLSHFYTYYLVV